MVELGPWIRPRAVEVLQALTRFFRRGEVRDGSQLELSLQPHPPVDADELLVRLRTLGLRSIARAKLTHNRNVMVSFGRGTLRVHAGFLSAPEPVLRAIVVFVEGRTRAERRSAQRAIVGFPVVNQATATRGRRRQEHTHPDDEKMVERLVDWHEQYNAKHFGARLNAIPIRVSRRMKSRLGHYTAAANETAPEIAISRSHIRRHGWTDALDTLLHEMVHQWQDETGRSIDHGKAFRAKCREVGIAPHARRVLARKAEAQEA